MLSTAIKNRAGKKLQIKYLKMKITIIFIREQNTKKHNKNSERIPLVVIWHQNLSGISKILNDSFEHIVRRFKEIFPTHLKLLSKEIKIFRKV